MKVTISGEWEQPSKEAMTIECGGVVGRVSCAQIETGVDWCVYRDDGLRDIFVDLGEGTADNIDDAKAAAETCIREILED